MAIANGSTMPYPLTKMNFVVQLGSTGAMASFSEVTGIEASVDVIEFRQGNSVSLAPVKIPGLVKHGNITLKMGYTRAQEFKNWIIKCVSESRVEMQRQLITIELIDINAGTPQQKPETATGTIIWQLKEAWVTKYTGPDLNASTSEVAIESVEIAYEELTIPN